MDKTQQELLLTLLGNQSGGYGKWGGSCSYNRPKHKTANSKPPPEAEAARPKTADSQNQYNEIQPGQKLLVEKHIKYAQSALAYEDVGCAIDYFQQALAELEKLLIK